MNRFTPKQRALLDICLAVVGFVFLGLSLSGLELQPGLPIPGGDSAAVDASAGLAGAPAVHYILPGWLQGLLAVAAVALLLALAAALVKKVPWKRIRLMAAGLLLLFAVFSLLPQGSGASTWTAAAPETAATPPAFVYRVEPIGDPPTNLLRWLFFAVLLLGLGLAAWLLYRALRPAKTDALADEVEAAVQALASGQDMKNVIIRCYLQMERILAAEQGVERPEAMTAREFESYLENRGIPQAPVHALTRLFEKARYGSRPLDEQDEQAAMQCILAMRAALAQTEQVAG